ncbi:MAG: hypothetical protein KAH57_03910 [Thermoplasmata archaeon]|nr:hypothetical protein [Thermoplasmata archaeon]
MSDPPILSSDLLRPYFRNMHFSDEKYIVDIEIFSDSSQIAFEICLECKEPKLHGAFPQRRFSIERHTTSGHEGVHVQINYHLINNEMDIGRLYITLEIDTDEELLNVAEGFVYTLYEILRSINDDMEKIAEYIFCVEMLGRIIDKKRYLVEKMAESLKNNRIQISNSQKKTVTVMEGKDFIKLLEERKELIPLIGPLVNGLS